jgi:DNA-binding SARP family transcriptional activator
MLRPPLFSPADLQRLLWCCAVAGKHAPSFPFLQELYREDVVPSARSRTQDVEIRCLGAFSLKRNGTALSWPRKAPRRPLELLKATIAQGPDGASVAQLTDTIWPGMDGDRAQRAFGTALYRLRGMLGERALSLSAGRLKVNREYAWVDAYEFEQAAAHCENGNCEYVLADLYAGTFLPEDIEASWAAAARHRLQQMFRTLAFRTANNVLESGRWRDALDFLEKALNRDVTAEVLYQAAICACLVGGLRAEAAAYYERCHRALSEHVGVKPSRKTESLYRQLLSSAD